MRRMRRRIRIMKITMPDISPTSVREVKLPPPLVGIDEDWDEDEDEDDCVPLVAFEEEVVLEEE
jgi:hypothetical protein